MPFPPKKPTKKTADTPAVEAAVDIPQAPQESIVAEEAATVTMTADQLAATIDAKVQAAVAAALRMQASEAKASGAASSPVGDDFVVKVASAVAMAISANQNQQANTVYASELAKARARQAKVDKCSICGQAINGCGGPWIKVADLGKLDIPRREHYGDVASLKTDKDGYILDVEGKRMEEPELHHDKMVVFPKDDANAEYFTGIRINGKVYLSNGPGHEIWVPRENNIAAILNDFEAGERRLRTPRKQIRQYGGSVSATGGATHQVPLHFTS